MKHIGTARRRASIAGLATVALVAIAGCTSSPDSGSTRAADSTAAADALDLSTVTLTLGQNDGTVPPLFLASGILDDLPYKVEFATFPDQVQSAAALVSGETDASITAQYTVVQAVAASTPEWTEETIPYVTAVSTDRIPPDVADWVGTVSSPASGITELTPEAVRGKKWTTTPGATNFLTMLQTLDYLGVGYDEIEWVSLSNADGALALLNNQVDLASGGVSNYTESVAAGGHNLLSGADVGPGSPGGLIVATAALDDPLKAAALEDFVARFVEYYHWKLTNPEAVQKVLIEETKSTPEAAELSWRLFHRGLPKPIDDDLLAVTESISALAFKAGAIQRDVPAALQFDDRFNSVVAATVAELKFDEAIAASVAEYP